MLWQRPRGLADKAINVPALPAPALSTRAAYHGAIKAWSKWLVTSARRLDDPTTIATTQKIEKGKPRPDHQ